MNERYILLGISVLLTLGPLAILGMIGMDIIQGLIEFKSLQGIYLNVSLDKLVLATVSKMFVFVFGIMSIVLAADPGAVRDDERTALPRVDIGLIEKVRAGAKSFIQAGASDAYCGDPARASAEEGDELIDALARMIVTSVKETWPELVK